MKKWNKGMSSVCSMSWGTSEIKGYSSASLPAFYARVIFFLFAALKLILLVWANFAPLTVQNRCNGFKNNFFMIIFKCSCKNSQKSKKALSFTSRLLCFQTRKWGLAPPPPSPHKWNIIQCIQYSTIYYNNDGMRMMMID